MVDKPTSGFLKIYRKFFSSAFWTEQREFSRAEAWLDLLNIAEFVRSSKFVRGKLISVEVGEVIASGRYLAERWSWSHKRARNFLAELERAHQITQRRAQGENIITVVKYAYYNSSIDGEGTPKGTQKGTDGAHRGHKYIRENKENKENKGADAPTIFSFLSDEFGQSERFAQVWDEWLAYRRERKLAKWTESTLKRQATQFAAWGVETSIANIAYSIANGWQGIFATKSKGGGTSGITLEQFREAYRDQHGADLDCDYCDAKAHHLAVLKCQTIDEVRERFGADYNDILALWNKEFSPLKRRVMTKLERK